MARYEPRATAGRVPSLFLKAEHSSQGVGYAGLGISIEPPTTKKASKVHLTFPTPLGRRFLRIIARARRDVTSDDTFALAGGESPTARQVFFSRVEQQPASRVDRRWNIRDKEVSSNFLQ